MITSVSMSEFREHLHVYVEKASAGELIQILRRGKIVAVLRPPGDRRELARQRLAELKGKAVVGDVVAPLGVPWEGGRDAGA
jgi:antitoxin (DNA-binding transcriptional repressor) of toxin-antitoxin stability system